MLSIAPPGRSHQGKRPICPRRPRYTGAVITLGSVLIRPVEASVILLAIVIGVLLFVRRRPAGFVWIGALAMAAVAVHLYWEAGRWQMVGLYSLVFVGSIWLSTAPRKRYRALGLILRVLFLILILASSLVPFAIPLPALDAVAGRDAVGVARISLPAVDDGSSQSIRVVYPAASPASHSAPYWDAVSANASRIPGLPVLASTHLPLVPLPATHRAPIAGSEPLPVMLLVYGPGWIPGDLMHLAIDAAANGWIVLESAEIDAASARSMLASLSMPQTDAAIGGRVDTNRIVVVYGGDAIDLELGSASVRIGPRGAVEAVLPGQGLSLEYPNLVVPEAAFSLRHRLAIPWRLLVGGSDVAPADIEQVLRRTMTSLLLDGGPTAPVFGGTVPDAASLLGDAEAAVVRPTAAQR